MKLGEPKLTPSERFERSRAGFHPGGPDCEPSRLARLRIPSQQVAEEHARCSEAAEEYRLKANDLTQQTRSADAAEVMARLTYNQLLLAFYQIIMGFITMTAAIFAAVYAGRAARAADGAIGLASETAERQLRAYVLPVVARIIEGEVGKPVDIKVILKNCGQTPAYQLRAWVKVILADDENDPQLKSSAPMRQSTITLGSGVEVSLDANKGYIDQDSMLKIRDGSKTLFVFGEFSYEDIFRKARPGGFRLMYGDLFGTPDDGAMSFTQGGNWHT